ncbi:hypothetical protein RSOLAG1IB_12315 [Rhizoctonia solani AG-1 IB]|uniref:DUF6535 domain-containing protein n=1 Tax=Thanatephorus cucumeris (strain AG1-IB / isolate 7/3/14) TaxID=1108050 RepID=A0A0B7FR78_THACB|nr:hypothetical protein RSOLAG1IB_12315 [Rhizoctonia solani AG-1 IB]
MQATATKHNNFDDYGAELAQDARVWKTSLDVTLIFAALFTAICTAFVIESSKSLKEDPPERSADRLNQMADILLVIANVKPPSELNVTQITSPEPFSPRRIDLCVNALWFFSLILSASVSLFAMLAKEWCYLFMSGRIGDSWSQTKKRQSRSDGVEKWKMENFVVFLPSLIHLAFLSFAVGLCLYLGDLHFAFIKVVDGENSKVTTEDQEEDAIKSVTWLIKTCGENPRSLDVALQALSGAYEDNEDRQGLLKELGVDKMIYKRLLGLDPYKKDYGELKDLYERAYSFFQKTTGAGTIDQSREIRSKLRKLQTCIERRIFKYVSSGAALTSEHNFEALKIGIKAPSHCLQSLVGGTPPQLSEPIENAVTLLEKHCRGDVWFNRPVMDHLIVGIAILLSRSATESDSQEVAAIVTRLIHIPDLTRAYTTEHRQNVPHRPQFTKGDLGLLLTVFALCRSSHWSSNCLDAPSSTSRTEKAIETIIHYYYSETQRPLDHEKVHSTMVNLGLLELLSHPLEYQLTEADFRVIEDLLVDGSSSFAIHNLPGTSDLYPYASEVVYGVLSLETSRFDLLENTDVASTYLTALNPTNIRGLWTANCARHTAIYSFYS